MWSAIVAFLGHFHCFSKREEQNPGRQSNNAPKSMFWSCVLLPASGQTEIPLTKERKTVPSDSPSQFGPIPY